MIMDSFISTYVILFLLPGAIIALAFIHSYLTREEGE